MNFILTSLDGWTPTPPLEGGCDQACCGAHLPTAPALIISAPTPRLLGIAVHYLNFMSSPSIFMKLFLIQISLYQDFFKKYPPSSAALLH